MSSVALATGAALTGAVAIMLVIGVGAAVLLRTGRVLTRVEGGLLLVACVTSLPILLMTG